jgi:hypothetical protein
MPLQHWCWVGTGAGCGAFPLSGDAVPAWPDIPGIPAIVPASAVAGIPAQ